jgi:hypothetical protein
MMASLEPIINGIAEFTDKAEQFFVCRYFWFATHRDLMIGLVVVVVESDCRLPGARHHASSVQRWQARPAMAGERRAKIGVANQSSSALPAPSRR